MTDNSAFHEIFGDVRLMAILRGMGVERSLAVATTAWDLGITAVEVTVQTSADVESLRVVAEAAASRGLQVGAGTVVTTEQVRQAKDAGAAFTVSPGFDVDVVRASHEAGLPALPGVATPTEVQRALAEGLTWLKAFPASLLGTGWFGAMRGPFPQATFVATGGMDAASAPAFLNAGVQVVAVGSALEDPAQLPALAQLVS
ncbi:bifunctional 4-hydroxy-2-oxoglutarate aldolase/2-dehydro-3-deoxy-phosphogluconate aldolase [Microbacterium horticulturae]|uniref:Bifunctional 4-hydroxy-2-oxoglutarate aldolase/2-dehydro-3-deoxy-phosphogluconate aldolase n=1 Tax=Microbacterium horticulturae TaxID=3028316 RepID=A0ABY8BY61_9MICO|nr:bifunctional 4-hydroxy-2-oxoglutarate aldolase/2-dehydro-3-deoxy-phosphogluconate aldolase [Microbacterium sp. KACC 23027]WEG08840.1 bifunctional 4-hydroxy-2-oxoglutarate aldolase/2-dehydro-3-deoxy-phosphogluconate aldolase [Microbacterium sp. KACC 23027]